QVTATTITLTNAITFNNSSVTFGGTTGMVMTGVVTLSGSNNLVGVAAGTSATLAGQLTGAANITKQGAGILVLTNAVGAASTYTGQTTVAAGGLNLQSATALGTTSAAVVASGAALQLQALIQNANNATGAPGFAL